MSRKKPFLDQVSTFLQQNHQDTLSTLTLIVPTYHTSNALLRILAKTKKKTSWAPRTYTLTDFLKELSDIHIPHPMTLLRHLYDAVHEIKNTKEPFENFLSWGQDLLRDLNTIDHYLLPIKQLFTIPKAPTPPKSFWATLQNHPTTLQKRWLTLWKHMPAIYEQYTKRLLHQSLAYEGLQRRNLLTTLEQGNITPNHTSIIAIGLHALTPAEEHIFASLKEKINLAFCWDYDEYYTKEVPTHPAGYYFRHRSTNPLFKQALPTAPSPNMKATPPTLKVVGAQGLTGQLEALKKSLEALIATEGKTKVAGNTIIVLPDPTILIPLIHVLPDLLGPLNISIGYPLTETPIYTCLLALLRYHLAWQESNGTITEPLINALQILSDHPYLRCDPYTKQKLITAVHSNPQALPHTAQPLSTLSQCLQPCKNSEDALDTITTYLTTIANTITPLKDTPAWEKTAINTCLDLWTRIATTWPPQPTQRKISHPLLQLLHNQSKNLSLPIQNNPSEKGIAIMSLSQTLGLDFAYVHILSMNEGIIPKTPPNHSFVPNLLQKTFQWPDKQTQEATTAYPLYRLLQHAKEVYCTYSHGDKNTGERSRYLHQLSYALGWPIQETTITHNVTLTHPKTLVIQKNQPILDVLSTFTHTPTTKAKRALSPSALNTYLDCPSCFYLQYIAHIKPPQTIEPAMHSATFGKLFHALMEQLYRPYIGTTLHTNTLKTIQKNVQQAIQKAYHRLNTEISQIEGSDLIAKKVLATFAEKVLKTDATYTPFTLIGLEHKYYPQSTTIPFPLSSGQTIALGGTLDRIDCKGDTIRIIDYKTGNYTHTIPSIDSLFEPSLPSRNKVAFQLLYYAWLYHKQPITQSNHLIMPSVISTRHPSEAPNTTFYIHSQETSKNIPLKDITPYIAHFEENLKKLLDQIFDPSIPFAQTEKNHHSPYGICQQINP